MSRHENFLSNKPRTNISNVDKVEYQSMLCDNKRSVLFWGSCFLLIYVLTFPLDSDDSTYIARLVLHITGILFALGFMLAVYHLRYEYALICTIFLVIQTSLTLYFMPENGYQSVMNSGKSVLIGLTCLILVMSVLYMFISAGFYLRYSSLALQIDVCQLPNRISLENDNNDIQVRDVSVRILPTMSRPKPLRTSRTSRTLFVPRTLQDLPGLRSSTRSSKRSRLRK